MKVEVFSSPDDEEEIADEDNPAGGYAKDVISEDGDPGDSQVRESVMNGEVIDCKGLEGACEDYCSYSLQFCGDEGEGEGEKPADNILHGRKDSSLREKSLRADKY